MKHHTLCYTTHTQEQLLKKTYKKIFKRNINKVIILIVFLLHVIVTMYVSFFLFHIPWGLKETQQWCLNGILRVCRRSGGWGALATLQTKHSTHSYLLFSLSLFFVSFFLCLSLSLSLINYVAWTVCIIGHIQSVNFQVGLAGFSLLYVCIYLCIFVIMFCR